MCSSAPDLSGVNAAAKTSAAMGQDAQKWFENYVDSTQGQRDQTTAVDNQVSQAQLAGMTQAQQQAGELDARNKSVFQPVEDQIVSTAQNYDTPERRDAAAAAARSGVDQNMAMQSAASNRALGRAGIAPGSAKSMSMNGDMATMAALGEQGASQAARDKVEATGHAEMMDAAGLGKGIVSNQATMLNTSTNSGQGAVGAAGSALGSATSGAGLMQTGYGIGMQGQQVAGNLFGQAGQMAQSQDSSTLSSIGSIAGMAAMAFSSKDLKTDKKPVSDEEALDAVNKLNVQRWDYKPGVADSGTHIGAYAQDAQKAMGNDVAPGGQMVNLPKMADMNTKAIQAATKQLQQIERQIAELEASK